MKNLLCRCTSASSGRPIILTALPETLSRIDEGVEEEEEDDDQSQPSNVSDCGSPLYDSELASRCHVIERHMMVVPGPNGSRQERQTESEQLRSEKNVTLSKKQKGCFMRRMKSKREDKLKKVRSEILRFFNRVVCVGNTKLLK